MKAVFCDRYGGPDVLRFGEAEKPEPKDDEMLVRIRASAVTMSDIYIRSLKVSFPYSIVMRFVVGMRGPRQPIIGIVYSGTVEHAGSAIRRFRAGDEVYGMTGFHFSCYAEYTCVTETDSPKRGCVALKPENASHEEATAAAYGGLLAFQAMEKGHIGEGSKVLIYGASGTTGTVALQRAKSLGAEVTAVCGPKNIDFVKSLGADRVLDYTKDGAEALEEAYDFVLDAVGKSRTSALKKAARKHLAPGGAYSSIDDGSLQLSSPRLEAVREAVESGAVKPILDRTFALEDIRAAHEYVGAEHKRGGVAVTVG